MTYEHVSARADPLPYTKFVVFLGLRYPPVSLSLSLSLCPRSRLHPPGRNRGNRTAACGGEEGGRGFGRKGEDDAAVCNSGGGGGGAGASTDGGGGAMVPVFRPDARLADLLPQHPIPLPGLHSRPPPSCPPRAQGVQAPRQLQAPAESTTVSGRVPPMLHWRFAGVYFRYWSPTASILPHDQGTGLLSLDLSSSSSLVWRPDDPMPAS